MSPEAQNEPSTLGDSPGPLFSLYSEIATEEDDKKIERWQKDADGILVFVSHYVGILTVISINSDTRPVYSLLLSLHFWPCLSKT